MSSDLHLPSIDQMKAPNIVIHGIEQENAIKLLDERNDSKETEAAMQFVNTVIVKSDGEIMSNR